MYKHAWDRKYAEYKFYAALQGVDIDKAVEESKSSQTGEVTTFQFGDPDEYKDKTPEERQKMTDRMLGSHKQWAGQSSLKGNK